MFYDLSFRQQQDEPRAAGLVPASAPADEEQIEIEYVSAPLDLESMSFGGESGAAPEEEEEEERFGGMGLGASGGLGFPSTQTVCVLFGCHQHSNIQQKYQTTNRVQCIGIPCLDFVTACSIYQSCRCEQA